MVYGHSLPNDRYQQPSLLYQRIKDTICRVTLWIKVSRGVTVIRALALVNLAVVVILSHFGCFTRRLLERLPWTDIMYLTQSVMSHSGCLRHGHFSAHNIKRASLTRPPMAHGWRLVSHWGKYHDVSEVFYYDMPNAAPLCVSPYAPDTITTCDDHRRHVHYLVREHTGPSFS